MRIVDKFPTRHHLSAYDWDVIFDGQCRELTHGEDVKCKIRSFVTSAYTAANKRGKKIRVKIIGNSIFIQARTPQ